MRYRRARVKGGTYFFTVVTYQRIKLFYRADNVALLRQAFKYTMNRHPFTIEAFVLLPDHLHCIWTLPDEDSDFSTRWRLIKSFFSRNYENVSLVDEPNPAHGINSASRLKKKEKDIWQRRFWEHFIRDEKDLRQHVEYIHYNPVKHGLVKAPKDWPYSSFHYHVNKGLYNFDWAAGVEVEFNSEVGRE
jgi:putative transposase